MNVCTSVNEWLDMPETFRNFYTFPKVLDHPSSPSTKMANLKREVWQVRQGDIRICAPFKCVIEPTVQLTCGEVVAHVYLKFASFPFVIIRDIKVAQRLATRLCCWRLLCRRLESYRDLDC